MLPKVPYLPLTTIEASKTLFFPERLIVFSVCLSSGENIDLRPLPLPRDENLYIRSENSPTHSPTLTHLTRTSFHNINTYLTDSPSPSQAAHKGSIYNSTRLIRSQQLPCAFSSILPAPFHSTPVYSTQYSIGIDHTDSRSVDEK